MRDFDPDRDAELVAQVAAALAPAPLDDAGCARLGRYLAQVVAWNRRLDLTAAAGPQAQVEVMLGDGMLLSDPALSPEDGALVDVGTGAGAPIVPLLLLRPDLRAVCCEPLHKRAAFLRVVGARLGLASRMTVLEQRLDPDAAQVLPPPGGPFSLSCSRATLAPERWLRLGLALAPRAWVLLAADAPPAPPPGASLRWVRPYRLPFSGAPRSVAVYARDEGTDAQAR